MIKPITPPPHPPKSTMSSPVTKIAYRTKVKNHNKTKIGVVSVGKANVEELENITREGINRMIRKEVV